MQKVSQILRESLNANRRANNQPTDLLINVLRLPIVKRDVFFLVFAILCEFFSCRICSGVFERSLRSKALREISISSYTI